MSKVHADAERQITLQAIAQVLDNRITIVRVVVDPRGEVTNTIDRGFINAKQEKP